MVHASLPGVHTSTQIFTREDAMFEDTRFEDARFDDAMFADSMLDTSWAQRIRRSWTTLTSFGLQALVIGLLLLLPVLKTVGLPSARTVSTPISLGRRGPMPLAATPRAAARSATQNTVVNPRLVAPGRVPRIIARGADDPSAQPQGESETGGSELGTGGPGFLTGTGDGLPNSLIGGNRPMLPTPPPTVTHVIRTSSMLEGNLIRRVDPVYPPLAKSARIQGPVVVAAIISKAGTIENLHAVSGPPLLVPATIAAVSQWRYRPYILNGEPTEVETQITVNFYLSGN
jgi:periplasmic protein TonB